MYCLHKKTRNNKIIKNRKFVHKNATFPAIIYLNNKKNMLVIANVEYFQLIINVMGRLIESLRYDCFIQLNISKLRGYGKLEIKVQKKFFF